MIQAARGPYEAAQSWVIGFSVYIDHLKGNPPAALLRAASGSKNERRLRYFRDLC